MRVKVHVHTFGTVVMPVFTGVEPGSGWGGPWGWLGVATVLETFELKVGEWELLRFSAPPSSAAMMSSNISLSSSKSGCKHTKLMQQKQKWNGYIQIDSWIYYYLH